MRRVTIRFQSARRVAESVRATYGALIQPVSSAADRPCDVAGRLEETGILKHRKNQESLRRPIELQSRASRCGVSHGNARRRIGGRDLCKFGQSHRSFVTVFDPSGPSLRTVLESQPPRPVVSTSRRSMRSRLSTSMPGTGSGTVIAGRSSMVVRFCAPADSEVAATSIAANVSDLTMLYLPWGCAGTNTGLGNAFRLNDAD
jgi:hypothetical protein